MISLEKKVEITFYSIFVLFGACIGIIFLVFAISGSSVLMFIAAIVSLGVGILTPLLFYHDKKKRGKKKKDVKNVTGEFFDGVSFAMAKESKEDKSYREAQEELEE